MWGDLSRREQILYGLVGALLLFSVTSWGRSLMRQPAKVEIHEPAAPESAKPDSGVQGLLGTSNEPPGQPSQVVVHVVGAVSKPMVIKVPAGSRVQDAIRICGGHTRNADLGAINLAAVLVDGTQLRIPEKEPRQSQGLAEDDPYSPSASKSSYGAGTTRNASTGNSGGMVSLNTGSKTDLESLPGVGPATAQKILDYRRQAGGFTSVEELLNVKGIGPKKFEAMRKRLKL